MKQRITIFTEGVTDQLFFDYLIAFLFKNAGKRRWDKSQLRIIPLDGICKAEATIRAFVREMTEEAAWDDTVCLIYDTDAFEYQKQPPVKMGKVQQIAKDAGCAFIGIGITHNVEDMIAFSLNEVLSFLKIPTSYKVPEGLSGLSLLKALHKEAGQFYIKGNKCGPLLKCLDYSSICKKFCGTLKPLCHYFGFDCHGNLCRIKKKPRR